MNVAAIQVTTPLIEMPSEIATVMTSETNVAMSATPPIAAGNRLRACTTRNGCRSAKAIVNTMTATMNPVTSSVMSSRTAAATMRPKAFADERDRRS